MNYFTALLIVLLAIALIATAGAVACAAARGLCDLAGNRYPRWLRWVHRTTGVEF